MLEEATGIVAADGGVGPETAVTGAPVIGVRVGVTLVIGKISEPLLTSIDTVTFEPAYWQVGATEMLATNELTDSMPEAAVAELTVAPLRAMAVKEMVPLSDVAVL